MNPAQFIVSDREARAHDGTLIPLTIIEHVGARKPQVTLLEAYGSYGYVLRAGFDQRRSLVMNEGITYAICHARGGGELGEAWRLAGKDANKHNTWQDDIAYMLRIEFSANGPPNVPEFGTVTTEPGFRNLLAMDSIQHVKKGVRYPAIMIAVGLNDPRVEPWGPAKFAAAACTLRSFSDNLE